MRCEVLEEPARLDRLCGYTMEQLREKSHHPERHFAQPHFMPAMTDSELLLRLNALRTQTRRAELCACEAFRDRDDCMTRGDIVEVLNRMSSMVYLMMIEEKKEGTHGA